MNDKTSNDPAAIASLPLTGMRVLDVSQGMAGPFCRMMLGDLGADVIEIEPPVTGDQTRGATRFKLKGPDSLGFIDMNRTERSVVRDLKTDAGFEHPIEGTVRAMGFPVKLGGTPWQVRRPPPLLGRHTEAILAELNLTDDEKRALAAVASMS